MLRYSPLLLLVLSVVSGGCTLHVTTGASSVARVQSERDRVAPAPPRRAPRPPRERRDRRPAQAEPDPARPEIAEAAPRTVLPRVPPRGGELRVADFVTSPHTPDGASVRPSPGERGSLLEGSSASLGRPKLAAPQRERDDAAEGAVDPPTQEGLPAEDKRLRRVTKR